MDIYGTKQIRNVVLLGHGGAGKSTVAEASDRRYKENGQSC